MNGVRVSELRDMLRPFWLQDVQARSAVAGTSSAMLAHSYGLHLDTIPDGHAPQFAKLDGSRAFTGAITINPGSATAPLILGSNGQGQTVVGLRADQLNKSVLAGTLMSGGGALTASVTLGMANGSAQYQVPVTGAAPFTPVYTALSAFAGVGLTFSTGTFQIGTPSSLSSTSGNSATGSTHSHAIDNTIARSAIVISASGLGLSGGGDLTTSRVIALASSSAPGAAASILASSAAGQLTLPLFVASTSVSTPALITAAGDLTITPAGSNVAIASGKAVRSTYTSGWAGAGYQLDYSVTNASRSFLEVDDISVRGTLNVYELLINQIRATNGTEIVSSVAKLASVAGSTWTFENADGANLCPFAVGDILLIQRATVAAGTLIKRIVRKVATVTGASITVGTATGGPADTGSPAKGDTVVRVGSETDANRRGTILLTSDMSSAPYLDVISGVDLWSAWGGSTKTKLRLGLLSGITGTANEYGLIAGSGFTATDSYIKLSSSAILQNNVPSTWKVGGVDFLKIDATNGIQFTLGSSTYNGVNWYDSVGGSVFANVKALNDGTSNTISMNSLSPTGGFTSYVMVKSYASGSVLELKTADATNSATHTFTGTSVNLNSNRLSMTNIGSTQKLHLTNDWQNLTNTNYPTTNDSEISNDDGTYKALMLGGNRADGGSHRRIMLLDHVHLGSNVLGSTAQPQQITGGNSDRIFSLAINAFGRATSLMANAYKSADSGHIFTSGQATYYGGQAVTTAPLLYHMDPNAVEFKWYYGPTNLASGASITTWTIAARLATGHFGANALRTLTEGFDWKLSGYTSVAPSATGYVLININGTNYKLLAST